MKMHKRLITTIIAVAFLVNSAGQGYMPRAQSRGALRPMASVVGGSNKTVFTEEQKNYWRPRLLRVLNKQNLLDENELARDVEAFLSIDSGLFIQDKGEEGLDTLYQAFYHAQKKGFPAISLDASTHHIILKEFDIINFSSCVLYCRQALLKNDIDAAITVLEITEGLYEEEIASFAEFDKITRILDGNIAELSDSIYESGQSVAVQTSQLRHDWDRFMDEDILRKVAEVRAFLGDVRRRIRYIRRHNARFRGVVGEIDGLSTLYLNARRDFIRVLGEFLRLRRALKDRSDDESVTRQWLEDNIAEKTTIQKELSLMRDAVKWRPSAKRPENTVEDDSDAGEPDADDKFVSKDVIKRREYIATLPPIEELLEREEALWDAEAALENAGPLGGRGLFTADYIKEILEKLLAPGFVDILEFESDKHRWYRAVNGLIELLPAKAAGKYERPADPLKQKEVTEQIGSAA